jgi:hypothetical protein
MKNNDTENNLTQTETTDPLTPQAEVNKFIELRAAGHSLGKISELIGVPKTTLFHWNVRNRHTIDHLKRIDLEALEERIIGSHQDQFAILAQMLDHLEKNLSRKISERAKYLTVNELFWMAANLRSQVQRLRNHAPITDVLEGCALTERNGTIRNENPPPPRQTS